MNVNIYALCEPGTITIRYVGKTRQRSTHNIQASLKERLSRHLYTLHLKKETHLVRWLRSIVAQGKKPDIILLDVGDENTWPALEMFHIAAHRQAGYSLVNATDGGEGCNGFKHTPEHLAYMSRILTGRKRTPEQRARMAESYKKCAQRRKKGKMPPGYISPMKGRPLPEEQKRHLSIIKKGKVNPEKHEVITCAYCNKQFPAKTCAKRKYCSNACAILGKTSERGRSQSKLRKCIRCEKPFMAQSPSSNQRYCSKRCSKIKQVIRTCQNCGKEYSTAPSIHPKFCSDWCRRTQKKH